MLRAIGGAQAQEPRAGRLQVRARSRGLTAADVERARVEERSLIRTWVMRGTIHLFPTEDAGWLVPLFSERIARWSRQRLAVLGIDAGEVDRALAAIRRGLASSGSLPRSEAIALAAETGIEITPELKTHLSVLSVVEGAALIGGGAGRESALVHAPDWIGQPKPRAREESLAELARRYFRAFAPATERDFGAWSGLPLRDCRAGLAAVAPELRELAVADGGVAFAPRGWQARAPRGPVVRLLGAFDTYLMGYSNRRHATDEEGERKVLPGGGVLRPTILVDGRFAGTWKSTRSGANLKLSLAPFEALPEVALEAIGAEAADIARFEGLEAAKVAP